MFFQNQLIDAEILKVLLMYKMDLNNKIISINFNNIDLVKEIKNEEQWTKYVNKFLAIVAEEAEKNSGNFKFMGGGQPHTYVQKHHDLMFAALVEFNSLQDAIDAIDDPRYQDALAELGENREDVVIRNLAIVEGT